LKRSLLAAVLIILPVITACGRGTLPEYQSTLNRVDSLELALSERVLEVRIFCSFGIGSCGLVFNEPLAADSVELHLLYGEGREYSICESLEVVVTDADGYSDIPVEDRRHRLEEGRLTGHLRGRVTGITIEWVDFYRS